MVITNLRCYCTIHVPISSLVFGWSQLLCADNGNYHYCASTMSNLLIQCLFWLFFWYEIAVPFVFLNQWVITVISTVLDLTNIVVLNLTTGILLASVHLGLHKIALSCTDYLESAPWDDTDEEEILKTIPPLGSKFERILSRFQVVDLPPLTQIFLSAFRFATSAPNKLKIELKKCYQDQIEYLLTEDDDSSLISITNNEVLKRDLKNCVMGLLEYFGNLLEKGVCLGIDPEFSIVISDILWICQILTKLDMMRVIVPFWVDLSPKIEKLADAFVGNESEIRLKVVEITSKVLESMNSGNVILPPVKRFDLVKIWIPIMQRTKDWIKEEKNDESFDGEIFQTLESGIVSVILTLPSDWQAEILSQWFASKNVHYPDLLEVFEVWSYRAKSAKRRFIK